ncbi:TonB-dependent receptor [Rubrivivax sp. RP6-9]|uniref:TonB-dependent receptor n=1 Tax=Rubrivivax sp. RP6-9 TaxID=3415750 RepID=UPI003CC5B1EA
MHIHDHRRPTPSGSICSAALVLLGLALSSPATTAQADLPPENGSIVPQEITVTAERTTTALRRTPISVVVIESRELERKGVTALNELVGAVAGVSVPNGFSNMPQAVGIRGVGVSLPAMSQAVGIYVDDVPLIRGYATALWDLPDIQRIEVLRGPQGSLYGQNSSAGAVKYVSLDPSRDAAAWLAIGAGNHGLREARGYVNRNVGQGPLSASLAFSRRRSDGYGYNSTLDKNVNAIDATQFRAKLRWSGGAAQDAVLAVDGLRDRSDTNTINFPLNHPRTRPRVTYTGNPEAGTFERDAGGISFRFDLRLSEGLKLRAITGYRAYRDFPMVADFGGQEALQYQINQDIQQKALSQELQLQGQNASNTWTAGLMFVADNFDFLRYVDFAPPAGAPVGHTEAQTQQQTRDVGLYGQLRHAFANGIGLTGGMRVYQTEQQASNAFRRTNAQRQHTQTIYVADDLSTSKTGALLRLGIDRQLGQDVFFYASMAQGAKFGGFNRAAESMTSARTATDPERVTTWEAGSKTRMFGGRLDASVALFYNDYRDYLANVPNMVINGVLVTDATLVNAGKAKTYGIDVDLNARVSDRVDATLTLELLRSKFDEFANPTGSPDNDYVGNQLPNAPHVSAGTTISYRHPFLSGASASAYLTLQHTSSQYGDIGNSSATSIPPQTYVHLGASFTDARQRWTLSARVRNLFDKSYVLLHNRIPALDIHAGYYNPPRTTIFTARYDF